MTQPYLYQTVHLRRGRPRLLDAHAALLAATARTLFGVDYAPDLPQLEARIAAVARAERYPQTVSSFVRIEVTADAGERVLPAGLSFYDGYALRSLAPRGMTIDYDLPLSEAPTSAREAVAALARQQAQRTGADIAVRCDRSGICRQADDAPLFAVRGTTVFVSPAPSDVERDLAIHAVQTLGLPLREEPIHRAMLERMDELFYVDHRGVTAFSHCDGVPYMSLIAERVAGAMESMF